MNIGIWTSAISDISLEEMLKFCADHRFDSFNMEIFSDGRCNIKDFSLDLLKPENREQLIRFKNMTEEKGVKISCLTFTSNPMNPRIKDDFIKQIHHIICLAQELAVDKISTYTGYNPVLSTEENIEELAEWITPLLKTAKEKNINILLETVPLMRTLESEGNFAYSPEMWDAIFTRIPDENFGINYDPSHLFWLGADYLLFMNLFAERIMHIRAKDSEIVIEKLRMSGILGNGWFRYRLPGWGSIDWRKFMDSLYQAGFEGSMSVDNQDSSWLDTPEKIKKGYLLGRKVLNNFVV